jgi:Secreted and surface protein containing fasciclin-like repeats
MLASVNAGVCAESRHDNDKRLIAGATKTKKFEYKQGFEKRSKDVINTLKDNEVSRFQTMLEALQNSYGFDETLKNTGPFTVFAADDKAWKKIPQEDLQKLFDNKSKLKQILQYQVVEGKLTSDDLAKKESIKTIEGHEIKLKNKDGDLWADEAQVTTADIPCTNGILHVVDLVIMPPLAQ